jgi:hypothetical protein
MNGRRRIIMVALAILLALSAAAAWQRLAGRSMPTEFVAVERLPRIRPDYCATVIPPNIAPLNFLVEEPGVEYCVRIHGAAAKDILICSHDPSIVIPTRPWRELLDKSRGGQITVDVYVKSIDGRWSRFEPIHNEIAREEIDSHLVYRLLGPVCNLYRKMGIYQRNLESYDESPLVTNDNIEGCLNCHCFPGNRPGTFSFQVRAGKPTGARLTSGMIVVRDGHAFRPATETKAAPRLPSYSSWNPNGSVVAFSMNKPALHFHGTGAEIRDVVDSDCHLAALNILTGAVSSSPAIADSRRLESFPGWSADGKVLYFVSAERSWGQNQPLPVITIEEVKYDLMCVPYDVEKDAWGSAKMVLSAATTGKSICEPRASPDGRYLLFCMSDYGAFPIHQASSDLYLMDLESREYRRLECNSDQSDAWHCWSSNSRWIVFSSRRDNGLLARPYFCYFDAQGRARKAFVLPQKDPTFYDSWFRTYNLPELTSGPVTVSQRELEKAILAGKTTAEGSQTPVPDDGDAYRIN